LQAYESMDKRFLKFLTEHHNYPHGEPIPLDLDARDILFKNDVDRKCLEVRRADNTIHTSYFVGIDWLCKEEAIFVKPKIIFQNSGVTKETDFIKMLFQCLRFQHIENELQDLFELKWDSPAVEIDQKDDLLTPLLIVEFLRLLKIIVRKGLKKSYYKVQANLRGSIKGKVLVSRTIKENTWKNKHLSTVCSYDVFGLDGLENRLLKLTMSYIKRYLPVFQTFKSDANLANLFNYVTPAFEGISENVDVNEIQHGKTNPFYKEYKDAIKIAKLILRRYGYNISNVSSQTIKTPPFWIDMSKLFELYVFGLLKEEFKDKLIYHPTYNGKELDFLLLDPPMVIDAKYKPRYEYTSVLDDARQLSGYSRMTKVYEYLNYPKDKILDCLIIYPNQISGSNDLSNFKEIITRPDSQMKEYVNFFKIPVALPMV